MFNRAVLIDDALYNKNTLSYTMNVLYTAHHTSIHTTNIAIIVYTHTQSCSSSSKYTVGAIRMYEFFFFTRKQQVNIIAVMMNVKMAVQGMDTPADRPITILQEHG